MTNLPIRSLFVAIAATILSSHSLLAQITVTGEVSGPVTEFTPTPNPSGSVNTLEVSNPGTFDADFSSQGEVELKFVWKAPAGQCFQVAAPADFVNIYLEFLFELDSMEELADFPDLGAVGFSKAKGTFPETASTNASFTDGSTDTLNVLVETKFMPGDVATFESFEITFNVATAYTHNFENIAVETFAVVGKAFGPNGETLTDPGAWLKLIPAPESRAEALARKASLSRDAKKLQRKFKKAKRKGQIKKARKLKKKFRRAKVKARKVVIPMDPEEFVAVGQEAS